MELSMRGYGSAGAPEGRWAKRPANSKVGRLPLPMLQQPTPPQQPRSFKGPRSYDPWPSQPRSPRDSKGLQCTWGSRPPMLREIEAFLDAELSLLAPPSATMCPLPKRHGLWQEAVESVDIAETRIFLEAFKLFISSSTVYGPLLNSVYHRASLVIDAYEKVVQGTTEVVRKVEAVERSCEERVSQLESHHQRQKAEWDSVTEELNDTLLQKEREVQEARSQTGDLKKIEKMYSDKWFDEREKVLTMVSQIKDAEEQHQETMIQFEKLKRDTMGVQDLMKLYQKTADELQQMKEDFSDHVPLKQFELLQRLVKEKTERMLQMKLTFASLRKRNENYEKQIKQQQQVIEQLELDCRRLRDAKGCDTPRPNWSAIVQENDIGLSLEEGKSSEMIGQDLASLFVKERGRNVALDKEVSSLKQRLSFLGEVEEQPTTDDPEDHDYFVGLGTGKEVPKYLRWFGQVKNRDLPKREVEHFIQDFWTARRKDNERYQKLLEEDTKGRRGKPQMQQESLEDFMHAYLKAKHGMQARIVDKGYNIKHACRKFMYDGDCELFLLLLEGTLPEAVYYEQMKMLEKLQKKMEELELPGPTGKRSGKVKKGRILPMLDKFFPSKSEKNLVRLKYELSKQIPGDEVNISSLFAEDREGNQGAFVEAVRSQMVKETLHYYQLISNAIFLKVEEASEEGGEIIQLAKVKDAILEADPQKPNKDIERMICHGLNQAEGSIIEYTHTVELAPFLARLKQAYLYRHTKPEG